MRGRGARFRAGKRSEAERCKKTLRGHPQGGPSKASQVLGDLPWRALLVVPGPLVPLHLDEVVDVVLATALAERLAEDVVPLELLRRLEKVRRQGLAPAPTGLVAG